MTSPDAGAPASATACPDADPSAQREVGETLPLGVGAQYYLLREIPDLPPGAIIDPSTGTPLRPLQIKEGVMSAGFGMDVRVLAKQVPVGVFVDRDHVRDTVGDIVVQVGREGRTASWFFIERAPTN